MMLTGTESPGEYRSLIRCGIMTVGKDIKNESPRGMQRLMNHLLL